MRQQCIPFSDGSQSEVLSDLEKQAVVLRKSGLILAEIGSRIGRSESSVLRILRRCYEKTGDKSVLARFSAEQKAEKKRRRGKEKNRLYNLKYPDRVKARRKRWEEKNAEYRRNYNRQWKHNNKTRHRTTFIKFYSVPKKRLERLAKGRMWDARRKGIPFDKSALLAISLDPATNCAVCGTILDYLVPFEFVRSQKLPNGPSIDRIIPSRGYIHGNIAVLCNQCNEMKGSASADQHRRFADFMDNAERQS